MAATGSPFAVFSGGGLTAGGPERVLRERLVIERMRLGMVDQQFSIGEGRGDGNNSV